MVNKRIRINLKQLLEDKNISIKELSEKTQISRPTLLSIKNEKSQGITYATLESLCNVLNVTPNDILKLVDRK